MTYEELKNKLNNLHLEDLAHGIHLKELPFNRGFEIAGFGITPQSDFANRVDGVNSDNVNDNIWVIYKGHLLAKNKRITVNPEVIENLFEDKAFDRYYQMVKEVETTILHSNSIDKYTLIRRIEYGKKLEANSSFEKCVFAIDLIEKDGECYLRRFNHTCSSEGNGRPTTQVTDYLYKVSEDIIFDEELAREYIFRHRTEKIILREESGCYVLNPDVYVEDIYGTDSN